MAPKKDKAADKKKGDKKKEPGEGKGQQKEAAKETAVDKVPEKPPLEKVKEFFSTRRGMLLSAWITFLLVLLAIASVIAFVEPPRTATSCVKLPLWLLEEGVCYDQHVVLAKLCLIEWGKTAEVRHATAIIKKFMISKDPSYENKDDVETILDAEKLASELSLLAISYDELVQDTADITYRLNNGWMVNEGAIYLLANQVSDWMKHKERCETESAKIVHIESGSEEDYIEKLIVENKAPYFIGGIKTSDKWMWDADNTEIKTAFWEAGRPSAREATATSPLCTRISNTCRTPRRCWHDVYCKLLWARAICKIKPLKKWVT